MPSLSADQMLVAWERGRAEPHSPARALALLAEAHPDKPLAALADLSVGQRDRLLLAIREQLFGPHLIGLAPCGVCGEILEVEFDLPEAEVGQSDSSEESLLLRDGSFQIDFRLPNSRDLLAIADQPSRDRLLQRLVLSASRDGQTVAFSEIPEPLLAQLDEAIEQADLQADIRLNLTCTACDNRSQVPFDIVSFLWSELEAWAIRLLREVHILARAYGWSQADILNLTAWRRHCYMEMLGE
jgi:hypothetical protein